MQSPFNDNVGGGWGPGNLASGLLQYYNQVAQEGTSKLAGIAGGFIGGGIGGLSASPQPGEAQPSGLSRFMSGGVQGALGEANPEYKKLQAASKSADYFMKAGGDDAYAAMGIHPDEWKTLGARDKVAAVQGYMQQQGAQARMEQVQAQAEERRAKAAQYEMQREEAQAIPAFAAELMKGRQGSAAPAPAAPASPGPMMDWQPGMPWTGGAPATPFDPSPSMTGTTGAAATPPTGPATGTTPGAAYSPEEMMGAMSRMGATNPRMGAAMMRVLIPKMMNGETGSGPTAWKSPEGNPYVFMNHTLIPDKPQMDPSAMMNMMGGVQAIPVYDEGGNVIGHRVPTGKGATAAIASKEAPALPASFFTQYHTLEEQYNDAKRDASVTDQELAKSAAGQKTDPAELRAIRRADLAQTQSRIKAMFETYRNEGYGRPETWQSLYAQFGLKAPTQQGPEKTQEPTPGSSKGKVTPDKAREFLAQAKGDKAKARDLAKKAGYEF